MSGMVDQHGAEENPRTRAERDRLWELMMETVGQLTGGLAHDFNNLLQAIETNLQLSRRRVLEGRSGDATFYLDAARNSVDRAAALTQQLLAFARKQTLMPQPVDTGKLIDDVAQLIRRSVGPAIDVETRTTTGTGAILCDENQMESALLNLANNARDAMPAGGRLTIGAREVLLDQLDLFEPEGVPREFVEIAVSDTGTGMSPEVIARAFEPFFTTKPIGHGTGLGLSQTYGFVRQSGGAIRLESAQGSGTTVYVYMPRHHAADNVRSDEDRSSHEQPDGNGKVVLLVEDEETVREAVADFLFELGYDVHMAADGSSGLRAFRCAARVDLLVTDVGLPAGMNGRELAELIRERAPGLPVLFITGYSGHALQDKLAPGMDVLAKPFALEVLATKLRVLLEGVPAASKTAG
jgi:nitrogen-specific signal transduction histidine kinase/ActR/RegA family two-component response regulator